MATYVTMLAICVHCIQADRLQVISIILSMNNIKKLEAFSNMTQYLPHVRNINFQDNQISDFRELDHLSNLSLNEVCGVHAAMCFTKYQPRAALVPWQSHCKGRRRSVKQIPPRGWKEIPNTHSTGWREFQEPDSVRCPGITRQDPAAGHQGIVLPECLFGAVCTGISHQVRSVR